jgi:hypothetical protein
MQKTAKTTVLSTAKEGVFAGGIRYRKPPFKRNDHFYMFLDATVPKNVCHSVPQKYTIISPTFIQIQQ